MRDELHEADGLIFKGHRMIIPEAWRKDMLALTHESHLGAEKSKQRARAALYWPNMAKHIEDVVTRCPTCLRFRRSNRKEPMIPHPTPSKPWEKVAADIMTFRRRDYLLTVDYFSKYVEIPLLQDKTAQSVILALYIKSVFARHGIPEEIIADNMPFNSQAFRAFATEWGVKLTTTSPLYPQSNGLAERNVQTVKQLLRKADYEGRDPYLALLDHRATPITGLNASPAELLMGRAIRTKLPWPKHSKELPDHDLIRAQLHHRQLQQKKHYDRHDTSTEATDLSPGDVVRIQRDKEWEPALVTAKSTTPRSYIVQQNGRSLRRNRRSLHPTQEPIPGDTLQDVDWPEDQDSQQDKNSGSPNRSGSEENEQAPTYTTASGRPVRLPQRFKDYVLGNPDSNC